jgi:hypothetical protein
MQYFTKELWQSAQEPGKLDEYNANWQIAYDKSQQQLTQLRKRVSAEAYRFFAEADLHDGALVKLELEGGSVRNYSHPVSSKLIVSGDFVPLIASSTDRLPVARPALLQFWRRFRGLGLRRVERCRGWISSSRNTLCDRISHRLRIQRVFCQAPIPHLDIRVRKWREIPITLIWPCAGHLVSTVDSLVRYSRDMYVHSEDLPLHLS